MVEIESFSGEYRWLSNFYPAKVQYEGVEYPSVEHAYQASKGAKEARQVFLTGTAGQAKRLGKTVRLLPGWSDIRVQIMEDLVGQKFMRHEELRRRLLATGDRQLTEGNYWGDTFWGVCKGQGENNLGKILMRVRQKLSNGRPSFFR